MNYFEEGYEEIHQYPEQLKRQQSALKLEMDSLDFGEESGTIKDYEVTLEDCTCADFQRRHKPCKHMYCLAMELGVFEVDTELINSAAQNKSRSDNIERYPVEYAYSTYSETPKDFVVIDFETANKNADSVCQMGIAVVENNVITEQKNYLICPPYKKFTNTHIHGIKFADVKDAPKFNEIWAEIRDYIQGRTVAAYNLFFDLGCLYAILDRYEIEKPDFTAFDILANARRDLHCSSYKLVDVARELGIEFKAHDAGSDSSATAKVQIYLSERFSDLSTLYYLSIQSIYDVIAKRKMTLEKIIDYSKELIKSEENLNYDDYKDLLKLMTQVAAQNDSGILYQNCGMLYERFEKFSGALSLYKMALSLDSTLRLKTRIQRLERDQQPKKKLN